MRTSILTFALALTINYCYPQAGVAITEKRNAFNDKGNFYLEKNDYKKAIIYYNMAFQADAGDLYSVLKKAEAYTKLNMLAEAEECYRVVLENNPRLDNAFRLKYALVLLQNNKTEEFKKWLGIYSQFVEEEIQSENYIVSKENRIRFYKDTSIVLINNIKELGIKEPGGIDTYRAKMQKDALSKKGIPGVAIDGFAHIVFQEVYNSTKTIMYFVSDAPGGMGEMDIYMSRLENGKWAFPENLGSPINTSGDELYPFLLNDTVLFFSSRLHTGMGGLDIFSVNLNEAGNKTINPESSFNSTADDFGLFLMPDGKSGYLTSTRYNNSEEIFRTDIFNFRIKYAAYQPRRKASTEENKLNILLGNGDEYNIDAQADNSFEFAFQPMEEYRLIVQKENIATESNFKDKGLTLAQKNQYILAPPPVQKAEIKLQAGLKYIFTAGNKNLSQEYKNELKEKAANYQPQKANTINLTALARELEFTEGEIYTIRFIKATNKLSEVSNLYFNNREIKLYGQSLIMVVPQKAEVNFNVQTDIEFLEKNFSSKKYSLAVDDGPVFQPEPAPENWLTLKVNTETVSEIKADNKLSATEISIIPGTEYLLTLSKPEPTTGKNIEIVVPLTRGVKYNLASPGEQGADFKKELAELLVGRKGVELINEEVIDISILSKELEVIPGENLSFTLLPVKQLIKKQTTAEEEKSVLTLDRKTISLDKNEKYSINIAFKNNQKINIQTDIAYIKENFEPGAYTVILDTTPFLAEIAVDTSGYGKMKESGWLSMSVNTQSVDEVEQQDWFTASEVSIVPGKEYILTVSKLDAATGKADEIIVPLLRQVKYDFTPNPRSEEEYKKEIDDFISGRKDIETIDGTVIDITLLSKELQIQPGDEISFSLLPVKKLSKNPSPEEVVKSSLFLDNKVVEFTQIQKYTINMPLSSERKVNMQTNIDYLKENFEPTSFSIDVDTFGFFSEITVDTTGYGDRILKEQKDPVYDIVTVYFNLNEAILSEEAKKTILEKVTGELKTDNRLYVTIKGFTDALGDPSYNLNLSKRRAESVKEFLKANGVGESRIRTISFGASQLLEKNINWKAMSEKELRKYRKVEIVIYLPKN
ncbi:MAG: OmpA family protein [Bacteroidales bacterium]|nr:OmpA family protein [Bacteroidales bacterium]